MTSGWAPPAPSHWVRNGSRSSTRLVYTLGMPQISSATLVRHEADAPRERSTCGWRHLLISRQDRDLDIAAWAHAVDIDGAREHYHKVGTEIYYVLDGEGSVKLDGVEHPVCKGSIVHIPPGVVHGANGRMRVLVIGIPDISEDDLFFPSPP
jgi:mannose-6-phosphate isomerase-like protein (cupin superfamily)